MNGHTLDDWLSARDFDPVAFVLAVARQAGDAGFTADDLRSGGSWELDNPGAFLGSLCQQGLLRVTGEEPARTPSSKGRRIRRFVFVHDPPVLGGGGP